MKRIVSFLLVLCMALAMLPIMGFAAEIVPEPFAHSNTVPADKVTMGGKSYYDVITFSMGYEAGSGYTTAETTYNFKGLYKSLSFDVGFVSGDQRDAILTVIADDKVVYDDVVISHQALPSTHTVSLEGVNKLTIRLNSDGYYMSQYAIANLTAEPVSEIKEEAVRASSDNFNDRQYQLTNAQVLNQSFNMGGYEYKNGYVLTMGYEAGTGKTAHVCFNFNGEYDKLYFEVAKYVDADNKEPATLTIEADGQTLIGYNNRELAYNDVSLPVEIDLTGVRQLVITMHADGYYMDQWAIGNIQIEGGPLPAPEEMIPTIPMHRMYNPNSGEHFYTGSEVERDNLIDAGWHYEGIAWYAPISSGTPVHRVYNPNSGDHHYTMSMAEVDMLVGFGWIHEGVAWNSAPADQIPQYRLYNPNAICGSHHYTSSADERNYLVSLGWILEGIGWYGYAK